MNNQLEQKLLAKSIKPTAMRLLVLKQLAQRSTAMSLTELESSFEKADRTTLYRTLKTFEKNKLIHCIDVGTGAPKYALCIEDCECRPEDLHVHFHCTHCKETYCITQASVPKVQLPINFNLSVINMVIKGSCGNCNP